MHTSRLARSGIMRIMGGLPIALALGAAATLPLPLKANPCDIRYGSLCGDCDDDVGAISMDLGKELAQAHTLNACPGSRSDTPDETLAPQLGLIASQGGRVPNAYLRHTPIHRRTAQGPDFALRLYHGYRYEAGNNGFARHMGKWSHNYELFLEQQDPEIWKLRDESGCGSTWIGPYWADFLGIGDGIMEIQSTDYSWLYELEVCAATNACGPLIRLRNRHDGVNSGMTPAAGGCGNGDCGSSGAALPDPQLRATSGSEGFIFEPVDWNLDGEVDYCRLKEVIGADGQALTLHYTAATNATISTIVDADGNSYTFSYNALGLLTNVLDVAGNRSAAFAYTNRGANAYLTQVTDMGGQVNRYAYEIDPANTSLLRLSAVQRPNLTGFDTTAIAYQGLTNATVTLPGGESYSLFQSPGGEVVYDATATPGAWTRQYVEGRAYSWHDKSTYGTQTNLVSPTGETRIFDWWDSGAWANPVDQKIKDEILPDGGRRHYAWHTNGHLASLTLRDAGGNIVNILTNQTDFFEATWRPSRKLSERRDAAGNLLGRTLQTWSRFPGLTTNLLDSFYALTSVKTWSAEEAWMETQYLFDTNSAVPLLAEARELASGTNDFIVTQRYGHDPLGRLVWSWQAGSATNYYTYDAFNRLAFVIQTNSGLAVATGYSYDPLDRLIRTDHPDSSFETWTQAPCGCGWLSHTDRGGNVSSNFFNANKWVWKTTTHSPNGALLAYQERYFDNAHNVTNSLDALGHAQYAFYDPSGRVTNRVDALGRATQTAYDAAGRPYLTTYPDSATLSNAYDVAGRMVQTTRLDAEGAILDQTLYTHDPLGRVLTTTDALGNVTSNSYDLAGRLIRTDLPDGSYTRTVYDTQGRVALQVGPVFSPTEEADATTTNSYDDLGRLLSVTDPEGRTTGYIYDTDWPEKTAAIILPNGSTNHWNSYAPLTGRLLSNLSDGVQTVYAYDLLGQVTNTLFADGSASVNFYDGTRLAQTLSRGGLSTTFGYDLAGRRVSVTNALGQTTRFQLDPLGQVTNTINALDYTTQTAYDIMNRPVATTLPDGRVSTNAYDVLGRLTARTGAGAVPVAYRYDPLGRMTNLVDGVGNVTAFAYDSMGRLLTKTYADASAYAYGYNARGWLTNRVDALGRATAYTYNNAGQLITVDYAGDPDVLYAYDTLGRQTSRVDAAGTWTWVYDGNSSRVLSETLSSPSFTSTVSYSYHPETLELASVGLDETHRTFYNWEHGRLTQVSNFQFQVSYTYKPNSDLLWKTTYGTGDLVVTRLYDDLDRLTNISTVASVSSVPSVVNSFSYTLDATGRRTERRDTDGSRLDWDYDFFDQLTAAARTNSPNGAADAAYRYQYQYDLVGNRLQEKRGPQDDPLGRQLTLDGSHNSLNQLTARDWSGKLPIHGSVDDGETVLVVQGITNAPPYWNSTNWLAGATLTTGSNRVDIVTYLGANSAQTDLTLFMPPAKPQSFLYDLNGNLTNDGYRVYTWDEENRLVAIETAPESVATGIESHRSEYIYDAQWRRIFKIDYTAWDGSAFAETNATRFVWDGWLLLAELTYTKTHTLTNSYIWGLDLSQSLQGAGGIGGMLAVVRDGASYTPCCDGNGNITDYLDANGAIVAHREYDPFGRSVAATGELHTTFTYWFSSKPEEPWWGLYYYGHRFYSPGLGRWASRDPASESGALLMRLHGSAHTALIRPRYGRSELLALYVFVSNGPVITADAIGLATMFLRDASGNACDSACEPDRGRAQWLQAKNKTVCELALGACLISLSRATRQCLEDGKKRAREDEKEYKNNGYNPHCNGFNAVHCLGYCHVVKECGLSLLEMPTVLACSLLYEECTRPTELCVMYCGNGGAWLHDVASDIAANIRGYLAGLGDGTCMDGCQPEVGSSGPKTACRCSPCSMWPCLLKEGIRLLPSASAIR